MMVTRFSERICSALGTDWEVQAQLLELVEDLNKLNTCVTKAGYPPNLRDEKMRYAVLGAIGDAIIDLIEACPEDKRLGPVHLSVATAIIRGH